ncbi:unnamed protein product, partial [Cylicostephanus goldi]
HSTPCRHRSKKTKNDVFGIPSDVALVKYVEQNASVEAIRQRYHSVHEIPFNSIRRWQLVVCRCLADIPPVENLPEPEPVNSLNILPKLYLYLTYLQTETRYVVMVKGAPEVILGMCKRARVQKEIIEIDEKYREDCQAAWEALGNAGRRVIAFAHAHFNASMKAKFGPKEDRWPEDLIFLGMAAIMDPPRYIFSLKFEKERRKAV